MLAANMAAPCEAEECGEVSYYWISRGHRPGTWLVRKDAPDGSEGPAYTVDCGDAADREDWRCDHNQIAGFSRYKVAIGCRHCCLVAALLKAVNIVP